MEDRASLLINISPEIPLDRGKVVSKNRLNHGSNNIEFTLEGNYLTKLVIECKANASDTAATPPQTGKKDKPEEEIPQAGVKVIGQVLSVAVRLIRPMKGQPRKHFDPENLRRFGENLKEQGQRQAAIVRKLKEADEKGCIYELISGERRWRSCQLVGIPELNVIVREEMDSIEQFVEAVIANCHDEQMGVPDTMEAVGYLSQLGKTDEQIANIFGKKSALWAYQYRVALEKLDSKVIKLLGPETPEGKRIPLSSAYLLIKIPFDEQLGFAEMISETGMSAKKVNHLVKNRLSQVGVAQRNRSSDEFISAAKFFMKMNAEIELYIDHADDRIQRLFKNRKLEQVRTLLTHVKDCQDNLRIVLQTFETEAKKAEEEAKRSERAPT